MVKYDAMENTNQPPEDSASEHPTSPPEELRRQRQLLAIGVVAVIIILAAVIGGIYVLAHPSTDTARVRDIFIILMAVESLFLGLVLVILIVQLARLINLLQNELKPILDSTNETVSTLRGTTAFLSDNLVEPVMKLNEYLAGLQQMLKLIGLTKKGSKKSNYQGE